MGLYSWLILAAVGAGLFLAVRSIVRGRRKGSCVGCSSCDGHCAQCVTERNTGRRRS